VTANVYVYGVIDAGVALDLDDAGLGPVRVVEVGGLGAVCSDVTADLVGRRRELKAHADVLGALCQETAVVPFSFGTVLPDDEAVRDELLGRHGDHLGAELDRLRSVLQLNVRLVPNEERLLADVVAGSPELARMRESVRRLPPGGGQAQRLRLGEAVARAYQDATERIGRVVIDALAGRAVDVDVEDLGNQEGSTRAAFLVERRDLTAFLDAAQEVAEGLEGRVVCRVVGPLPPFSFVVPVDPGPDPAARREASWAS
jgi:hypothetical protein